MIPIPTPESESSFDSDSGVGIAPGLFHAHIIIQFTTLHPAWTLYSIAITTPADNALSVERQLLQ